MTQAITTAEQSVRNNSFELAAFGGPYGAHLVYTIIIGTSGMEFHKVKMQQMQRMMHSSMGGPGRGIMMIGESGTRPVIMRDRRFDNLAGSRLYRF